MHLLKLINPSHGLPPEHKEILRMMKVYAGGKRKAVRLLQEAVEIRKSKPDGEAELLLREIAKKKAYTPNAGEKFLGLTRDKTVSGLTLYLLRVKPIEEAKRGQAIQSVVRATKNSEPQQ